MDDPSQQTDNPALNGYVFSGTESPAATAYKANLAKTGMDPSLFPYATVGPGGKDPTTGLAYSWLPYDSNQQLFDSHQHFGPTYDDPVFGKLQSMYTEPSKSQNDFWHKGLGPTLFGAALSAITAGAGSSFLGPLLKGAIGYGSTGQFNPMATALSFLPAGVGAIDPSLLPILNLASGGYQAARGNPIPGAVSLGKLVAGGP